MRHRNQDRHRAKRARVTGLAAALLVLAGLSALAAPARAEVVKFEAMLDQNQAVPAPTPVDGAGGRAYVTLDRDSNEIAWNVEYYALSGAITAIHFHGPAGAGETGDIAVTIDDGGEETGKLTGSAQISDQQEQHLMDGQWYVNVHTALNGPGEIRGQLVKR